MFASSDLGTTSKVNVDYGGLSGLVEISNLVFRVPGVSKKSYTKFQLFSPTNVKKNHTQKEK